MFRSSRTLSPLFILFTLPCLVRADAKLEQQVVAPYLEVRSPDGTGSGVAIDYKGEQLVLTAAHVVEGHAEVKLVKKTDEGEMETTWVADVVAVGEASGDVGQDLALLRPKAKLNLPSAKLDFTVKLERGEDVWVVGSHSKLHGSLEKTIVNRPTYRITDDFTDRDYLLVNGNVWYGNSGGPVFAKRGEDYVLVGIVVRLAALNPRTPICCEKLSSVEAFLKDPPKPKPKEEPKDEEKKDDGDPEPARRRP